MRLIARTLRLWVPGARRMEVCHSRNEYFSEILPESSFRPGLAAVVRQENVGYAVGAIEGNPFEGHVGVRRDHRAVLQTRDERAYVEAADRHCCGRRLPRRRAGAGIVWNPVCGLHPKTV